MSFADRIFLLKLNINWFTEYALIQTLITLIEAFAVTFLWNQTLPSLFSSVNELTYGTAVLLILLCKILSRSWQSTLIKANLMNIYSASTITNNYLQTLINLSALASQASLLNTQVNIKQKQEDSKNPEEKL